MIDPPPDSNCAAGPSHGRAEASLPILVGLYWGGVTGWAAPAPW